MKKYKGKVAIVTGAASGMGRAVCKKLGEYGATVIAADINESGAINTAKEITDAGGKAKGVKLDVAKRAEIEGIVKKTAEEYGRLDYMFNNAGIGVIGDERDKTFDDWQRILNINFFGELHGTIAAYELMIKQGFGHIVNTSSMAGYMPAPTETAYSCVKHAIVGLSTSLRVEGADLGVKVTVVCPGVVDTSLFDTAPVLNASKEEILKKLPDFMKTDVDRAAQIILRGVRKNRTMIVFPFHARVAWWISRACPSLLDIWGRHNIRLFRKFRAAS